MEQPKAQLPQVFHLTTVHEALARAAAEPRRVAGAPAMGTHTFRMPEDLKAATKEHCERHGADLDSFLRQCCRFLLYDYKQE